MITDGSVCSCGVLSLISPLSQIQPSEGAAAQTPLAANTGVLSRAGAQAGFGVGDSHSSGHGTSGNSGACAPCVRHTSVIVSESMLCSSIVRTL